MFRLAIQDTFVVLLFWIARLKSEEHWLFSLDHFLLTLRVSHSVWDVVLACPYLLTLPSLEYRNLKVSHRWNFQSLSCLLSSILLPLISWDLLKCLLYIKEENFSTRHSVLLYHLSYFWQSFLILVFLLDQLFLLPSRKTDCPRGLVTWWFLHPSWPRAQKWPVTYSFLFDFGIYWVIHQLEFCDGIESQIFWIGFDHQAQGQSLWFSLRCYFTHHRHETSWSIATMSRCFRHWTSRSSCILVMYGIVHWKS